MQFRPEIEGLRAIAVMSVVLFHAGLGLPGGFVGVDVFFVISGFLITQILQHELQQGQFSIWRFYERRLRRLGPALLVVLAGSSALALMLFLPKDLTAYANSLLAGLGFVSNIYFYLVGTEYFVEAAITKPLLHLWSLGVEAQFYVLFPLLLWGGGHSAFWRAFLCLIGVAASFALCLRWSGHGDAAFYLPQTRVWELGVGALLVLCPAIPQWIAARARLAQGVAVLGLALILWAVLSFEEADVFPGWRAAVPVLGTALVLATPSGTVVGRLLSLRPFLIVGRMSYSLYLWHWPVLVFASYGLTGPLPLWQGGAAVAVSVVLAALSLRYVEDPVRRGRVWKPAGRILALNGVSGAVLMMLAGAILWSNGLPQRLPVDQQLALTEIAAPNSDCFGLSPQEMTQGAYCQDGAPDTAPRLALLGDSHANAIARPFFDAASDLGLAGWHLTAPVFLPLPGRDRGLERENARIEATLAFLKARDEITHVFVSRYWVVEATGQHFLGHTYVFADDDYDGSGRAYNPVALQRGMARLARLFPEKYFILLDDVPTGLPLHAPASVRGSFARGRAPSPGLSRAEAEAQRSLYAPLLQQVADGTPNVVYTPLLVEEMCGPETCPLFTASGQSRYRNGDHITPDTAKHLVAPLRRLLAQALLIGPS